MRSSKLDRNVQKGVWGSTLRDLEHDRFVGRTKEIEYFRSFLAQQDELRILHIYGTGGLGKTFLLHAFQRIAEQQATVIFLMLDSDDFVHSPDILADQISFLLASKRDVHVSVPPSHSRLEHCILLLKEAVKTHRIVLAVDSYEKMGDMERWFREFFLRQLPTGLSIILAGRDPLKGDWIENPAWRSVVTQMKLSEFDYDQTSMFLRKSGIDQIEDIHHYWLFTKGHPLTLSMIALSGDIPLETSSYPDEKTEILSRLTTRWLSEVPEENIQKLLEAAAVLRHFDQMSLSHIINDDVTSSEFSHLTSLSFIYKTNHGWAVHDLIRSAIIMNLKERLPDHYQLLRKRSAFYFLNRLNVNHIDSWNVSEFFYHIGEELIQSAFFQGAAQSDKYIEDVGAHNFAEVETYFRKRQDQYTESSARYYNRHADKTYTYFVSAEHNQKENELIDAEYVKKFGYRSCKLVKDSRGVTIGLSISVPINTDTLPLLKTKPVSRAYFRSLSAREEKEYRVSKETEAGWFIRMLDCLDPEDADTRSYLLYNLFPFLLSSGRIIISTPISFFQDLIKAFGFEKIPDATHYDYGVENPSPTYLLDVRGARLIHYLKQLAQSMFSDHEGRVELAERLNLTKREQEIFVLVLREYTNKEIATELFVTEITVKKHVSKILQKFGVSNRTQLIKRTMEMLPPHE
ncbi:LuxR C-terminal-related transcriptional regulator [Thalassobacillus sp. CUG 92003]|uniref:LuxR C-terminal-related transcriptional regulator n=1 Tax=Thalassobacillus sp. CUG 92003 TaxID=2736641 RepID=UPI00272B7E9B|nr:LuxR C-terminal-related transcriptional regulator [Thalassobacillus sp. CUG 92003]